ncbi:MAG TPA: DUF2911 domain-containing protein [Gemmatimonadaceae bacterium]|nr:DUF2911 domain-containing protein [Gemmatimonadaceae bacterium]
MTPRSALLAAAPAILLACRPSTAVTPSAQSGAYVIRLGNDTLAVDQYTRTGNRVEGTLLQRTPRTTVTRYVVTLNPDGTPASVEQNTRLPDGSLMANAPRSLTVSFVGDSAITQVQRDTQVVVRAAARNAYPTIGNAFSLFALPIAALRASGRDSALYNSYAAGSREPNALAVARKGPNRYWVYYFGNPFEVTTDDQGRMLAVDGARTTLHIQTTRQPVFDVAALATTFAERERQSRTMGVLSPRDTVTATISGAQLWVDYSRPMLRGRHVFGATGVLGDTIWRTGANAATQFRTSAPLTIGGQAVPPGMYTLWTVAMPGRYQLIVNKQVGQWGTVYDPTQDLVRVPLQASQLGAPVERFTILVDPTGDNAGTLRFRWDTTELAVPFTTP